MTVDLAREVLHIKKDHNGHKNTDVKPSTSGQTMEKITDLSSLQNNKDIVEKEEEGIIHHYSS